MIKGVDLMDMNLMRKLDKQGIIFALLHSVVFLNVTANFLLF